MKKLLVLALCLLLLCLCACGPKVSKSDPFSYVVKDYCNRMKDDGVRYDYDGHLITVKYALWDIDDNNTKALLLYGLWFYDVYVIKDGVAVLQQSFKKEDDADDLDASLLENGTIMVTAYQKEGNRIETVNSFYHFKDGELKLQAKLIGVFGGNYFYASTDDNRIPITEEEYVQLMEEYAKGGFESPDLDWKPLAEYGR